MKISLVKNKVQLHNKLPDKLHDKTQTPLTLLQNICKTTLTLLQYNDIFALTLKH